MTSNKKKYSIFEVAGPIMVGPSSSHTAGACKIGQMARALFHHTPEKVIFYLHGSFGTVYQGHSTDRALLAGIMKFRTSDLRIKDAFKIAKEKKITYEFKVKDLGKEFHPNTVKVELYDKDMPTMSIVGSSLGGGIVKIVKVDQFPVEIHGVAGHFKTLVAWHDKGRRVIKEISDYVEIRKKIRIHDIQTKTIRNRSLSIFNLDGRRLKLWEVLRIEKMTGVYHVRSLTKLDK